MLNEDERVTATAEPANHVRVVYGAYVQRYVLKRCFLQRCGEVLERRNVRGRDVLVLRLGGGLEIFLFPEDDEFNALKTQKGACESGQRK